MNAKRSGGALATTLAASFAASALANPCDWETFRDLSHPQKAEFLPMCAADEQIELYLRWSFATRPANADLVELVASSGKSVVEAIVRRIERNGSFEEDGIKPELIHLLYVMHIRGHYAVADDSEVMRRVTKGVGDLDDETFREFSMTALNDLRAAAFGSRRR